MKTILYQPLFINPQAYFVFPQLYHIEKGDSFIEPANITGQLIINTFTQDSVKSNKLLLTNNEPILLADGSPILLAQDSVKSNKLLLTNNEPILLADGSPILLAQDSVKRLDNLTLTPTIFTVKDNNQVDFNIFAGKHIRISQYTDEGAVVLGEWYIPDTPTLPEPEQPQKPDENDILKSLIVHYNVGKQGSNNIKTTSTLTDYSGNNRNATCKNFDWNTTEFVDEGKAMRFDGNGSCIVAVDMPQIDKYTLIVKRRWIDKRTENKWFCSLGSGDYTSASQSLFWFEGGLLNNVFYTYNRGYKNPIVLPELISIQSSDDYNGTRINASDGIQAGNKLFIGSIGENDNTHVVADFYQLLLFDRVLTDAEREWVKENMIEPDTVSAAKACSALFEPENLEITGEFPNGVIRDSLGGNYYLLPHSSDYTIENGLMKSTDNTFLVSIENANENDVKAMMVDMYYDSTVPGSYLNGEYTEGSVKLLNRRIMGINNPTTTSIFQDLLQVLEDGFTIGKIALYNRELNKDEFDSEAFHKGFAVRHSTFEKNATTHLFRDGHKELVPGEYLLPFENLYLRVDVPEGHTMQNYVFDEVEQTWKPNTPKAYVCPEYDFHIIVMGEQMKTIKNWSPLASISTFNFKATDNQIQFAGSTDGGTMKYILDDTDVTKFTIEYTNTTGEGNVYLMIDDKQYDVISGQPQTYSVSGSVTLDFLNMKDVTNFAGNIKFTNIN